MYRTKNSVCFYENNLLNWRGKKIKILLTENNMSERKNNMTNILEKELMDKLEEKQLTLTKHKSVIFTTTMCDCTGWCYGNCEGDCQGYCKGDKNIDFD